MSDETNNLIGAEAHESNPLGTAHISFIGCGVMAEAIITGLLRQKLLAPTQIAASHPRPLRRQELRARYGINVFEENREAAVASAAPTEVRRAGELVNEGSASIVVLSVKPQRLGGVLQELRGALRSEQLVVSIVAGARVETISEALAHTSVVRAMPNTPAQIGAGMTAWYATPEVADAQIEQVRALFGSLGREMRVETEHMIDMATALSATGPTYIFMMMEALVDAGVHLGFSRHVAQELVIETMLGSVLFAQQSRKHPAELRNMVTSPGGTSAEAIYQMEKGSLRTVLSKAVHAAYQRAVALGGRK